MSGAPHALSTTSGVTGPKKPPFLLSRLVFGPLRAVRHLAPSERPRNTRRGSSLSNHALCVNTAAHAPSPGGGRFVFSAPLALGWAMGLVLVSDM